MTSQEAWKALRSWVASQVPGVPVVLAFQNAPAPAQPYIALSKPNLSLDEASERVYKSTTVLTESVRNHYTAVVQAWAVVEDRSTEFASDILRRAFAMRTSSTNSAALAKAGISIRNVKGPNEVPRINGSSFVSESTCTVTIAFSHTDSGTVQWIDTVNVTDNVD